MVGRCRRGRRGTLGLMDETTKAKTRGGRHGGDGTIEADRVPSMVLWGPPGTGKTTLARVVAASTGAQFEQVSAVSAGVADLRRIVAEARERRNLYARRTILFIDEIHRFNRAQQDAV